VHHRRGETCAAPLDNESPSRPDRRYQAQRRLGRRLLRFALTILRVDRQSGADLEIALTEACSLIHFEKSFA
jgi:hypothetical protein